MPYIIYISVPANRNCMCIANGNGRADVVALKNIQNHQILVVLDIACWTLDLIKIKLSHFNSRYSRRLRRSLSLSLHQLEPRDFFSIV